MNAAQETWLVAVSAGADSMALLSMCLEKGMQVAVAHVNYHTRPQSEEEEVYVRSFCKAHAVVCHVENRPFVRHGNFEASARAWRYGFFVSLVRQYGYKGVLVAHQEDDLLETYCMQRERKIVPACYGLREESEYEGVLIRRPLLNFTKEELEAYCRTHHILYFHDVSNDDLSYTRNRVRHTEIRRLSLQERSRLRREIQCRNDELQLCRQKATDRARKKIRLSFYRALSEADRLTLLRKMMAAEHARLAQIREWDRIVCKKEDYVLCRHDRQLVLAKGVLWVMEATKPYAFTYETAADLRAAKERWFTVEEGKAGVYACTFKETDFPITIRTWRSGDAIAMRFGTKKIQRWFIDRKIPRWQRALWPLVCDRGGKVIMVPGIGCDRRHHSSEPSCCVIQCFPMEAGKE